VPLIRRKVITNPPPRSSTTRGRVPPRLPSWLRDYIADQGQFVLLDCGHKDNLTAKGALLIVALTSTNKKKNNTQVFCDRCRHFAGIVRHMRFSEYANIPVKVITDAPLF
jgi:hypothetical protein